MNDLISVSTADLIPARITGMKVKKRPYVKSDSILFLEQIAMDEARRLHPTNPHLAPRIFRDDSSSGLTACIVKYVTLQGGFASRTNNQGTFSRKLNQFIRSTARRGLPDIQISFKGNFIGCEVKINSDRQSEHQKKIQEEIENSGGQYVLASNFTDFKAWFDML